MSDSQSRFGIEGRALLATALAGAAALAGLVVGLQEIRARSRVPVEQRVLESERDALRAYLADPVPSGGVVPFGDILVNIRASLVGDLIEAALPIERTVDDRFVIRVDSARVTLRTGLALVELSGRARLAADEGVFADIRVMGALEVGTGPDDGSNLEADVSILGIRTRDVGVRGLSPPAERLVDELARVRLSELDRLLDRVPIPVRLDELVELPGIDEDELTIPATSLDVVFRLAGVRVLEEGIFASLSVGRIPGGAPARPDSAAPPAPVLPGVASARGGEDGRRSRLGDDELARLATEVDSLRARFEQRLVADSLLRRLAAAEGDILIGLRTPFVQDVARWAARGYLNDVALHLRPGVTVEEGDEVDVKVGPISVHAGDWRVQVTINSVRALLRADSIELTVADSNSMTALVVVDVSEGRGDADIRFEWDATTLASVVCRDFEVDDAFGGTVDPFTYSVEGRYVFEASPDGILAIPRLDRPRLRVSPRPTEESWERARSILDEQNEIFRCGLALRPDDMIERLDRLLRIGFEFQLPEVLFQPVRLPARIEDRIDLGARVVEIRNVPVWLEMSPEAIWYGSTLELGPGAFADADASGSAAGSTADGAGRRR